MAEPLGATSKMKHICSIIFGVLFSVNSIGQSNKFEVADSVKMMAYWEAFLNYGSTTPNFIVFKGIDRETKETREICEQGPWIFYEYINRGRIKVVNVNKRIFEFESFNLIDTISYMHLDSTKTYVKTIRFPAIDSIRYSKMVEIHGERLLSNAEKIIHIDEKLLRYRFTKKGLFNQIRLNSLERTKKMNYIFIRKLYSYYGKLVPYFYFNCGILTCLDCIDGSFLIDNSYRRNASP